MDELMAKVTRALTDAGLYPQDIGNGILNLYSTNPQIPAQTAHEPDPYLGTVTVTITP